MSATVVQQPLLHVSEVFGPTVQGEGPNTGRLCMFVRLGGCNLSCAPCDTPYTWDGSRFDLRAQITARPVDDVLFQVSTQAGELRRRPQLVVVSGGEPLLHQHKPGLRELVDGLVEHGFTVQFETNGTLVPAGWLLQQPLVQFVVSPKVAGPLATDPQPRRLPQAGLQVWAEQAHAGRAWFKVVVGDVADVDAVVRFADWWRLPRPRVWVMPAGDTAARVLSVGQEIADAACREGLGISTRLHLLLWPHETRGR